MKDIGPQTVKAFSCFQAATMEIMLGLYPWHTYVLQKTQLMFLPSTQIFVYNLHITF